MRQPGTYILIFRSKRHSNLKVGRWGQLKVIPGYYLYIGSAFGPGGVYSRVSRHCRKEKNNHWHIDYVRQTLDLEEIIYTHSQLRLEHKWATMVSSLNNSQPIIGFGSSDCSCKSHFYFFTKRPEVEGVIKKSEAELYFSSCSDL